MPKMVITEKNFKYSHAKVKRLRDRARSLFGTKNSRAYDIWFACEKWLGNMEPGESYMNTMYNRFYAKDAPWKTCNKKPRRTCKTCTRPHASA